MEQDAKPPKELSDSGNLAANWNLWKKEFQTYMKITKGFRKPEDEQVAWLKNFIGPVGLKAFEQIVFQNPKDEENMSIVMEKLSQFFIYSKNQKVQRYKFFSKSKQNDETIDDYIKDLVELSKSCNFGEQAKSITLDAIILNVKDEKLRKHLFEVPELTLNKVKNIYKNYELTKEAKNKIEDSTTFKNPEFFKKECCKCGQRHAYKNCPAFGKTCHYCHHLHHFSQFCPVLKTDKIRIKSTDTGNIFAEQKLENAESRIQHNLKHKRINDNKSKSFVPSQNKLQTHQMKNPGIKPPASIPSLMDEKFQKEGGTFPLSFNTINTVEKATKLKNVVETKNEEESPSIVAASTSADQSRNKLRTPVPMANSPLGPSVERQNNIIIPPSYNSLYPNLSSQAPQPAPRQYDQNLTTTTNNQRKTSNPNGQKSPKQKSDDCTIQ